MHKKKQKMAIAAGILLSFSLSACGAGNTDQPQTSQAVTAAAGETQETTVEEESRQTISGSGITVSEQETGAEEETGSSILVAYFTMPETDGVDAVSGASRVVVDGNLYGNTQYLANLIQERTGGELFEIETVQEYPGEHEPLIDQAAEEQSADTRPELAAHIENLNDYDVIFLGYPNWWADLPMPLYTFLEEYDFSGKTIIPFNSHGGSRFSGTIETIQRLQPGAEVIADGYTISRDDVGEAGNSLGEWLTGLGY